MPALETVFSFATFIAMFGWILLVVLPADPRVKLLTAIIIPLTLSAIYLTYIFLHIGTAPGGFGSLAEVKLLFGTDELLLAGWIHYLAFDLFVGAWESRDSQRLGIPRLVMVPCYLMTFMLGPIGLLFYFAIRTAKTRSLSLSRRSLGEGGDAA
ncbi:MAG: ABA4-like family protein [Acidobacteriota bacterium]|nr:ABA4-like family protein [Acidobacteriota bacterium]